MQVMAIIKKTHVWKYPAWLTPSTVSLIAMPTALMLITWIGIKTPKGPGSWIMVEETSQRDFKTLDEGLTVRDPITEQMPK